METTVIIQGTFTKNKRGAIASIILGITCILDGIFYPLLALLAIAGAVYFFYLAWFNCNAKKQEFIVYPDRIYVKLLQKAVEIPIDKISSIEKQGPYAMKIKSSSGTVKVNLCTNRDAIADEITKLMNRNKNSFVDDVIASLRMYQELFNEGTITQEEFEAKKKQLLGL